VHSLTAWIADGVVEMTLPQTKAVTGPITIAGID